MFCCFKPLVQCVCVCVCVCRAVCWVMAAPSLLPPVKSVLVYRNGDPFYSGRRFVVNQRQVTTMEVFLNEVTQSIGARLAVRTLYTPRQGHRVTDLQQLQTGAQYVAAGSERFKKLDYLNVGAKKQAVNNREETQAKGIQRPNVSAKWRKFIPLPCILHVFRNGDLLCPPFRFIIPRTMLQDLEQVLSLVTEKVNLRTGAVRRLCSMEGVAVSSAAELETGHCYVAVGTERFKKLPYVELLVSKATERYCCTTPSARRQKQVFLFMMFNHWSSHQPSLVCFFLDSFLEKEGRGGLRTEKQEVAQTTSTVTQLSLNLQSQMVGE
uniref:Doublecortin domain-containing protein 2-like n=1 Tax=Gouania willdenowi TaxID=441366 RepID=A0A8C5GJC0_GOUWI